MSTDGKQIAAIEYADDGSQGVVLMDADGSDAKIIATAGANQNIYANASHRSGHGSCSTR